ncbi:polymorphic toxin-type HINT domain-containing protein [Streptomyces toxytricini]|uniref:Polymorphic toxin-type HINT domain-containing protein n=1 Tax=Streptomyces toxytricini TaxID=67369 RepID=A0ABW8EEV1_STRT5
MIYACEEIKCDELRDYVIQHGLAVEAVYGPWESRNLNARAVPKAMPANYRKISTAKVTGCQCFLAGTKVEMADGTTKNIEDVQLGDEVRATDPRSGETGKRPVTRLIVTENDKHFNKLSIATPEGISELTATYEHPFWSPSENAWLEAADLKPGMTLQTSDGTTAILTANHPFTQHAKTYNLTVADLHTYYVLAGETPVLVHNSDCPTTLTVGGPRVRPGKDIDVDEDGFVNAPTSAEIEALDVQGLSTFDNVTNAGRVGLRGQVRAPAASIPDGLGVIADGRGVGGPRAQGHQTIYPTRRMSFDEYVGLIQGVNWQNVGKKL